MSFLKSSSIFYFPNSVEEILNVVVLKDNSQTTTKETPHIYKDHFVIPFF